MKHNNNEPKNAQSHLLSEDSSLSDDEQQEFDQVIYFSKQGRRAETGNRVHSLAFLNSEDLNLNERVSDLTLTLGRHGVRSRI